MRRMNAAPTAPRCGNTVFAIAVFSFAKTGSGQTQGKLPLVLFFLSRCFFLSQGYSISKNVSDNYFATAAETSGLWDSITLCPADNVGPIQSKHQKNMGPWQHNIEMMLDPDATPLGGYPQNGAYRPWMTVDVRDDAACHVALLESVRIKTGERYIAWSCDSEPHPPLS
jgi:hypothetical protein